MKLTKAELAGTAGRICPDPDYTSGKTARAVARKKYAAKRKSDSDGDCQKRLTQSQVREVRRLACEGVTHGKIAGLFDMSAGNVGKIARYEIWPHL